VATVSALECIVFRSQWIYEIVLRSLLVYMTNLNDDNDDLFLSVCVFYGVGVLATLDKRRYRHV